MKRTVLASIGPAVFMAAAGVALAVTVTSVFFFAIPVRGVVQCETVGASAGVRTGYARIQPLGETASPGSFAVFRFRQNQTLVTEAAVPAVAPATAGRIYAEVNGPTNTGIAIVNPNNQSTDVSFFFTDSNGENFGQGSVTLPPNSKVSQFLNEPPFNGGSSIQGTFTFTSSLPVGVIALRGFVNERSEFLITTMPVTELASESGETVVFPHFADGGGWTSQIVLVNPVDVPISGFLQFLDAGSATATAQPIDITVDGRTGQIFSYSLPPRSSRRFQTSGSSTSVITGSVRVTPLTGFRSAAGVAIFSFKRDGITVTESGVPALRGSTAFRLYVEESGDYPGQLQTGVAIASRCTKPTTVTLELLPMSGAPTQVVATLVLPSLGQVSRFLKQIPGFERVPFPNRGVLRLSTEDPDGISVVGLRGRYNERGDFLITATPPVDETRPPARAEILVPHLVDGGGYTSEFVLMNGSSEVLVGSLRFFAQSGQPLTLTFK